jgi:hypothetical protein
MAQQRRTPAAKEAEATDSERLLTPAEFRKRTKMSRAKEDRLRRIEKRLPHYKIGGRIFYGPKHVEEFLQSCEQRPVAA